MLRSTGRRRILGGDGSEREEPIAICPACGPALAGATVEDARLSMAARTPISAVMSRDVFCVRRDVSEEALAAALVDRGLGGAPVVDDDGRLVGFVSLRDVVRDRVENGDTGETEAIRVRTRGGGAYSLGSGFHIEEIARNTVGGIMDASPVRIDERTPIGSAAALMASEGAQRIAVVDEAGRVVGLACAADVMRWLCEQSHVAAADA
jgi:CBS-domain-containing membrane protein